MSWSKKYTECKNCRTKRFPYKLLGYCSRCYYPMKRLEEVKLWDLEKLNTLKGYPKEMMFHNPKTFGKAKKGHLKQYKDRLDSIRYNEETLKKSVSGHDLEFKIREIARLSRVDGAKLFFGTADFFGRHFNKEQRKLLYEKLNRITENKKWEGINWYKIFNDDK